jgi:hypothetical protein
MGHLTRALWSRNQAHVKALSESPERKVGQVEESWVLGRKEGLCSFSLRVCERREISWGVL